MTNLSETEKKENSESKINVRAAVFRELCHYTENDTFINISIDNAIKKLNLTGFDRDFFTALVYGVIERQITVSYTHLMTMRNYIQAYVSSIFRITSIGFLIIKFPVNLGELSGGETLCGFHLVRETVSISRL